MKFIKKFLSLPSPIELNKSSSNSLPIRFFDNDENSYTWSDYREEMKNDYPIRYFLNYTLISFFKLNINKISNIWYWIRCHTYNKYHLIDIGQPETNTNDDYKWGWIDEDHQLLLACFNILKKHVECRNSSEFNYSATLEGAETIKKRMIEEGSSEEEAEAWAFPLREMYEINKYWTIDRKKADRKKSDLLTTWHDSRRDKKPGVEEAWNALKIAEQEFDDKEIEMLIRLIKIRKNMWT